MDINKIITMLAIGWLYVAVALILGWPIILTLTCGDPAWLGVYVIYALIGLLKF